MIARRRLLFAACTLPALAWAQNPAGVPAMKPPIRATPAATPGAPRTIQWEDLVPPDWDPFKDFRDINFQLLDDGDSRANALLKRMREVWDAAPVNPQLAGQVVRIPGFVVPLEDSNEGLKEFLLVPYFGACIHSPPPPANQIIHVKPQQPARGMRSMDAVWISGVLEQDRIDTHMGVSGWTMAAQRVERYEEPQPGRR
jgi:hypothetical protein